MCVCLRACVRACLPFLLGTLEIVFHSLLIIRLLALNRQVMLSRITCVKFTILIQISFYFRGKSSLSTLLVSDYVLLIYKHSNIYIHIYMHVCVFGTMVPTLIKWLK